ncbi:hypothetical protein LTR24_003966 [Lithohypha guttulata]|uniref:Uncharacterized protein n=1 Tax=Lithohypha guttulata TaxID=1690604 RepID=A0ABR0KD53_9EURO|nr:hypothetical protein LTR24_003966 [Lithohypha guttulata]
MDQETGATMCTTCWKKDWPEGTPRNGFGICSKEGCVKTGCKNAFQGPNNETAGTITIAVGNPDTENDQDTGDDPTNDYGDGNSLGGSGNDDQDQSAGHQDQDRQADDGSLHDDIPFDRNSSAQPPDNHAANDTQPKRSGATNYLQIKSTARGTDKDAAEDTSRKSARLTTRNASLSAEALGISPSQPAKLHRGGEKAVVSPTVARKDARRRSVGLLDQDRRKAAKKQKKNHIESEYELPYTYASAVVGAEIRTFAVYEPCSLSTQQVAWLEHQNYRCISDEQWHDPNTPAHLTHFSTGIGNGMLFTHLLN